MENLKKVQTFRIEYQNRGYQQDITVEQSSSFSETDFTLMLNTFRAFLVLAGFSEDIVKRIRLLTFNEAEYLYGEEMEDILSLIDLKEY